MAHVAGAPISMAPFAKGYLLGDINKKFDNADFEKHIYSKLEGIFSSEYVCILNIDQMTAVLLRAKRQPIWKQLRLCKLVKSKFLQKVHVVFVHRSRAGAAIRKPFANGALEIGAAAIRALMNEP